MKCYLTIILLFITTFVFAQDVIMLQHNSNPKKFKLLDSVSQYIIKTEKASYKSRIITFTGSTLTVSTDVKAGYDTIYNYNQGFKKAIKVGPIFIRTDIKIAFADITYIKRDLFRNRKWLEPFGYLAIGAGLSTVLLPIAAIDKGSQGVKEWAVFAGILLAVSGPPVFIGTRKVTYNLNNKWSIKTKKNIAR